jgi:Ca-activated chloride channel family protein
MQLSMESLQQSFLRDGVNHLILLTDGRTYGDEDLCISLAKKAAELGVTINSLGIGSDWNDLLLDDLSSRTGGSVLFLDSPTVITALLSKIFHKLERVVANRVTIDGAFAQQVDLRSTFRLEPDPLPLGDQFPLILGHLPRDGKIRLLLEMVIHPIGQISHLEMAHLTVDGDILGANIDSIPLSLKIDIPVSEEPDMDPPPQDISQAISKISLYEMQEKARHEAEIGQAQQAARRLENLATQLLAAGERELAKAALNEAARVTHTRKFSSQGGKFLKYGTRALLLPAKTEDT